MTDQLKFYAAMSVQRKGDESMSELNIYQRINKVMQEVKYAQKDASVQGYKAVTHDLGGFCCPRCIRKAWRCDYAESGAWHV